eukprot:Gb_09423 [translate_table: standard]
MDEGNTEADAEAALFCWDYSSRHGQTSAAQGAQELVSTENITSLNKYNGNDRAMMMTNCLLQVEGSSLLLSNRPSDVRTAKIAVMHSVRVHLGANDDAYNSIIQREDQDNVLGVFPSIYLIEAAGLALQNKITF